MATEKKYLDLQGLQHLKEQKVLVKHPDTTKVTAAAVKVGHDADGHVELGGAILPSDIGAVPVERKINNKPLSADVTLGVSDISGAVPNTRTIAGIDLKDDITKDELRTQLGITGAMHFAGTTTTALTDGATTNPIQVNSKSYTAIAGDVVLYSGKEFIWTGSAWEVLGDEGSYALKTRTITAGTWLTGGGDLTADRTISHAQHEDGAKTAAPVKVGHDAYGHVVLGGALGTANAGTHKHTITASVPASKFVDTVTPTSKKISLNPTTDTFIKSYPGVTSKLVTTTITGTNGTVTASKATAGTAKDVAKAGTAVVYGKANVGEAKTVATRASAATTVGNANVGTEISILGIDSSTTATASKATKGSAVSVATTDTAKTVATLTNANLVVGNANVGASATVATSVKSATATATTTAYTASYANECLTLGPATVSVTPTVELNTTSVTSAASASTKLSSAIGTTSVTPAKSNGTITPYTFSDVTVPVAAASATAFTPAAASSTTIWGVGGTTSITPAVAAPDTQTIIPAVSNGTITPYTFEDITAAKVASTATTIATGALATDGSGATILTGLGTATTGSAIKTATIQSGTTGDIDVVTSVSSAKNTAAVSITASSSDAGEHNHDVI